MNEKPICYNESYTFTVYKDIAVTSVYVEEAEEIQKEVSVLCDVSYANGRVKFLSNILFRQMQIISYKSRCCGN